MEKTQARYSSYRDYIAVDVVEEDGKILSTPFYITEGKSIRVDYPTPSNERPEGARTYEDFHEFYQFKMENGELYVKWINGPIGGGSFSKITTPAELLDWQIEKATKIHPPIKTTLTNGKE